MSYPQGTAVSFNDGVIKGKGKICGVATAGAGKFYIVELDKQGKDGYTHHLVYETYIKLKPQPKRFPIPVKVWPDGGGIMCEADDCQQERECANHCTAGDFRSEDGMTPDLALISNNWHCTKKDSKQRNGALIFKDGNIQLWPDDWRGV